MRQKKGKHLPADKSIAADDDSRSRSSGAFFLLSLPRPHQQDKTHTSLPLFTTLNLIA